MSIPNRTAGLELRSGAVARFCVLLSLLCTAAFAQIPSPWVDTKPLPVDTGSTGLKEMLRRLNTTARLMHTVAHPDDEDGGMLTLESRGHGVSVLQLTLNRGEGGQNKLGSNLFDELGIIRTLELLAADRYYGVEQRFTRVADFGFSKTPEETFQKWGGHDIALGDMVRAIRTFRPDVICTRFQGAPRDGHGHHQASGILTREAFRAAADPARFSEQLREGLQPWQAKKLYMDNVRAGEDWTVQLETSQFDPLLGETYVQFAWKGLKHQLSQGAGSWTLTEGRRTSFYKLIDSAMPKPPAADAHESDFFDGIDTSLPGLVARLGADEAKTPWLRPQLAAIAKLVDEAITAANKDDNSAAKPLLQGRNLTRALITKVEDSGLTVIEKADLLVELRTKREQFEQAANLALALDLKVGDGTPDGGLLAQSFPTAEGNVVVGVITAGMPAQLMAQVFNGGSRGVELKRLELDLPPGWKYETQPTAVRPSTWNKPLTPGLGNSLMFRITAPENAAPTKAYFHRNDPDTDAIYQVDDPRYETLALPPPPIQARVFYTVDGEEGVISAFGRTPMHDVKGDVWSIPLVLIPQFSIEISPSIQLIRAGENPSAELGVRVRFDSGHATASIRPELPAGWRVDPASENFRFDQIGQHTSDFKVLPDGAKEARYNIHAQLTSEGRDYSEGYSLVARPDIGGFFYYQPALQRASVVEVNVPPHLKVGYIMGAGDDIPTVLRQVGLDVTLLTLDDLVHGNLSRFDTIVLGIRAYDTRDDVKKNNQRLLDYVSNGGTLLVQYNTSPGEFNAGHYTPFPLELSRDRVTVEEAPVTILDPHSVVLHYPNQITLHDFDGWVQERGLYFMDQWDPHYTPLLASNDPGEQPHKGGLLVAKSGKGYYIYTGYAFFRQLPFGVPGAIRLYVNLLSVGHEPK